jgi:hypothetical protein
LCHWGGVLERAEPGVLLDDLGHPDQASGAYVGPTCWAVMFLAGTAAILHDLEAWAAPPLQPHCIRLAMFRFLQS